MAERIFLKLGGSLITDKRAPETPRLDVIHRLAAEIAAARAQVPGMQLVIGHGSGSFGHVMGSRYGTRNGVATPDQWYGFAAVADAAARLNRIVTAALLAAGIPAWTIQPSATLRCRDGRVLDGPAATVTRALEAGLVPVIHGDVALDDVRGGTIASTEEIFDWLAPRLQPQRMVLAGEVDGIYTADPQQDAAARRLDAIRPADLAAIRAGLGGSHGVDVTGGMAAKVAQSLAMVQALPGLRIVVCGGLTPDLLKTVLVDPDAPLGTHIYG